jgi:O-antigen/teichoic acid export membrane protein
MKNWGLLSLLLAICASIASVAVCYRFVPNDPKGWCLILYVLVQCAALFCSIVAAARGSRWWLALSVVCTLLILQSLGVFAQIHSQQR